MASWPFKFLISVGLLLAVAFMVAVNLTFLNHGESQSPIPGWEHHPKYENLIEYCAQDTKSHMKVSEGKAIDGMELKAVLIAIRHGDRSPIHKLPGVRPATLPQQKLLQPEVLKYVDYLNFFELKPLDKDESVPLRTEALSTHVFSESDYEKPPGQLTSAGFMQHILLGKALRQAYSTFIKTVSPTSNLYVRSTHYHRTIQSVAGLVASLFNSQIDSRDKIQIETYLREGDEVMHGIGLRSSSNVQGGGEMAFTGGCDLAVQLARVQKERFRLDDNISAAVRQIFDDVPHEMSITDITDSMLPSFCHHLSAPCTDKGCMVTTLLSQMKKEADRLYCERHAGHTHGANASKLAFYPLLKEIADRLNMFAADDSSNMAILSGHDSVIAPILGVMGVSTCGWPPYASRVVFELWHGSHVNMRREKPISSLVSIDGSSMRISESRNTVGDESEKVYVRVLYNGDVITRQVTGCATAHWSIPDTHSRLAHSELCPLSTFNQAVESLLHPYTKLEEVCKISTAKSLVAPTDSGVAPRSKSEL